ncbi:MULTISPECIES: hypothetical protein [unclassified Haloferax]|uniref:hypothetical protein n=1 Tax=unclassified Haloferax TaxID=2625095 RepID=UPI002874EDED|nr:MULTISPECIES: hypothetical protein [unclassified Haloferax]MDS0241689.1 hypothetical protein [Haloferax sp. S2CR25]MDS0444810.1 hypothetical protein [Haloferax sp. S2CR25-2]
MTNFELGRWLLVALAIAGLAVAAPVVSAHGDGPTADDAPPADGTAADWAAWMESQMAEHMGPESVEWMESHMGVTVDEMARYMADNHDDRTHGQAGWMYGQSGGTYGQSGGMYGQGHC